MKLKGTALVIGKFHPLHKGHEFLLNFAGNSCDKVIVLVDKFKGQTIPEKTRAKWIKELFPTYIVKPLRQATPQQPEDLPDFWNYWRKTITRYAGKIDYVVASETYGIKLSEVLQAQLIMCNQQRSAINISATTIKGDTLRNWDKLTEPCKRDLQQKVLILGPECSGKTTTAKFLADNLGGTYVPEYVEEQLKADREISYSLLEEAITCQAALEISAKALLSPILIMDSNFITTQVWCEKLFGKTLKKPSNALRPDITLLFRPLEIWRPDKHRMPEQAAMQTRQEFFNAMKAKLERLKWPFKVISGTIKERNSDSTASINKTSKINWELK